MRFLSFKKKYSFKILLGVIEVNPVERIKAGLKKTTLRKNKKHLGLHQIRQGSYFKPEVAPFLIRILRIEPKGLGELTPKEVQVDLGLTDAEFASIREPYPDWSDFQAYLLKQFRRISGIKTFSFEDAAYLHYFEIYRPNAGQTLDRFMKKYDKSLRQLLFWRWWGIRAEIAHYGDSYDRHQLASDLEEEIRKEGG